MASCVRNICIKNYQKLIIGFQVTVKNVGDVFLGHSVVHLRAMSFFSLCLSHGSHIAMTTVKLSLPVERLCRN